MEKTLVTAVFVQKYDDSPEDASDLAMKLMCEFKDVCNAKGERIADKAICNNNSTMKKAGLRKGNKYVIVVRDIDDLCDHQFIHDPLLITYPIACQRIFI